MYLFSALSYSARRRLAGLRAPLVAAALSLAFGGCSYQLPSLLGGDDDATASIDRPARSLADTLDGEDWRRAHAALGVALDPQGNGAPVNWDNPRSGAKGTFTPVGGAYPSEDSVCRAFLADIEIGRAHV